MSPSLAFFELKHFHHGEPEIDQSEGRATQFLRQASGSPPLFVRPSLHFAVLYQASQIMTLGGYCAESRCDSLS
jgi:hypothetical protein